MLKRNVFVGSSTDSLKLAEAIKVNIDESIKLNIWKNETGNPNLFEKVMSGIEDSDFGLFIISDDINFYKKNDNKNIESTTTPNVLTEIGMFIGNKSINNLILLLPENKSDIKLTIPSDLDGYIEIRFDPVLLTSNENNNEKSIKSLCSDIEKRINSIKSDSTSRKDGECLSHEEVMLLNIIYNNKLSSKYPIVTNEKVRILNYRRKVSDKFDESIEKLFKENYIDIISSYCIEEGIEKYLTVTDQGIEILRKIK